VNSSPFSPSRLEEEKANDKGKTIGVWFNDAQLADIARYGVFLHQEKPATIIKQMLALGAVSAKLLDGDLITLVRDTIFNNVRKNRRLGIVEVEPNIRKSSSYVSEIPTETT